MRAVLDCNVIVSGLIRPDSPPAHILNALVEGRIEAVLSASILEEYHRTLLSRKLRPYLSLSSGEIEAVLASLALTAFWVKDQASSAPIVVQDPSDDIYLLAAAESRANYVVSGDRHLLSLGKYESIPIVTPRDFLQKLR